jgi:hypothetical protein
MPEDAPAAPTPSGGEPSSLLAWFTSTGLKESVTSIIAIAVTIVTLVFFNQLFNSPSPEKRQILEMLTPIFGVVLGYYFGRVPAEARAKSAENAREAADSRADKAGRDAAAADEKARGAEAKAHEADKKVMDAKATVRAVASKLSPQSPLGTSFSMEAPVEKAAVEGAIEGVRDQLEDLARRLGD